MIVVLMMMNDDLMGICEKMLFDTYKPLLLFVLALLAFDFFLPSYIQFPSLVRSFPMPDPNFKCYTNRR